MSQVRLSVGQFVHYSRHVPSVSRDELLVERLGELLQNVRGESLYGEWTPTGWRWTLYIG
jgi:hypothetical protein